MDVRSVVTKNKIKMALLNCIKEKPLANILNKDIIAKSEVSARTFYHYYSDKDEVLNEIENEILAGLKKGKWSRLSKCNPSFKPTNQWDKCRISPKRI